MLDDHVARRHGDSRALFDIETLEYAVVDDRGIALRAETEAKTRAVELEAHCLREVARAIREHRDVGCTLSLLPRIHDPWVVDADARDRLDAFRLQFVEALHEARQVNLRASGSESAGNREKYDLAFAENLCRTDGLGHSVVAEDVNLNIGDLVTW